MKNVQDDPNLQFAGQTPKQYSKLTHLPKEDSPYSDPNDIRKKIDDTHPATDTNIEPSEEYDEGLSGAAEAEEP